MGALSLSFLTIFLKFHEKCIGQIEERATKFSTYLRYKNNDLKSTQARSIKPLKQLSVNELFPVALFLENVHYIVTQLILTKQ